MTDDSDIQAYRLKDDIDAAVRSGLVLRGEATIKLSPTEAEEHADVLVPVEGDQDDGADQEADE